MTGFFRATRRIAGPALLLASVLLGGCGGITLNASDFQVRAIMPVAEHKMMLTLKQGMVWCQDETAARCLRLPPGVYTIEAEDADFRYFRAPEPIDFRRLDGQEPDSRSLIPGGIALRKTFDLMLPAEVYVDGENAGQKVLVHKLGHNFAEMEPSGWTKNFD